MLHTVSLSKVCCITRRQFMLSVYTGDYMFSPKSVHLPDTHTLISCIMHRLYSHPCHCCYYTFSCYSAKQNQQRSFFFLSEVIIMFCIVHVWNGSPHKHTHSCSMKRSTPVRKHELPSNLTVSRKQNLDPCLWHPSCLLYFHISPWLHLHLTSTQNAVL